MILQRRPVLEHRLRTRRIRARISLARLVPDVVHGILELHHLLELRLVDRLRRLRSSFVHDSRVLVASEQRPLRNRRSDGRFLLELDVSLLLAVDVTSLTLFSLLVMLGVDIEVRNAALVGVDLAHVAASTCSGLLARSVSDQHHRGCLWVL